MFLSFYLCPLVSSFSFLSYQEKIYEPHKIYAMAVVCRCHYM